MLSSVVNGANGIEKQTSDLLGRKDQYDPTNVSHKQYFMPQAYPPVSKKTSSS